MDISTKKINESFCHLICERGIAKEIEEYFSFLVPGYQYMRPYKQKIWDGKLRLCSILPNGNVEIPLGLMNHLYFFCQDRKYSIEKLILNDNIIPRDYIEKYIESLNIHSQNKKIEVRDYQLNAIIDALNDKRRVLISPTSSGKSLILYGIIRYFMSHNKDRGLMIVPNVSLCHQMYSDFDDYSTHVEWDVKDHVHRIFSGTERFTDHKLVISTWQSISAMLRNKSLAKHTKEFLSNFQYVLCDEAHLSSGKDITNIINLCTNAEYKIGVTGTLNGTKIHSLQLEALFGDIKHVISTKELINKKQVTDIDIKCLVLKYPELIRVQNKKLKYPDEIQFLVNNPYRNRFIKNLTLSLKGNTLVLFNYISHGELLFKLICESKHAVDKKIYFIHGNIKPKEREEIRHAMEKSDNVILIASVGTTSTGTNIRNLHNVIFTMPSKSPIRTKQSIGRVLRLHTSKEKAHLYDIADDLRYRKHTNYTLLHFYARLKMYDEDKFDYKILTPELKYA